MHFIIDLAKRFFGAFKKNLILGPLFKTLEVIFDLITPLIIAWMIDAGVLHHDNQIIVQGGVILVVLALLGFLATLVCQKMASVASQGIGTSIRSALERKVNRTNVLVLSRIGSDSLETRITNDVNQIQVMIAMLIRQVIRWPLLAIGSVACALAVNLELGLVFCVCLPLIAFIFWAVMKRLVPFYQRMQLLLDTMSKRLQETFSGIKTIRVFNNERYEEERFSQLTREHAGSAIQAGKLDALLTPATFLIMNVGALVILLLAMPLVGQHTIQAGDVIALFSYMNQLLLAIVYVANLVVIFTRAETSSERVLEVLDLPTHEVEREAEPLREPQSKPEQDEHMLLKIDDLSYAYEGAAKRSLDHITLSIKRGETLGIIGGTGSGKTTLINLIAGLYDLQGGSVSINGTHINTMSHNELSKAIAVVPQKPSLMSGTIRSNLLWRNENASDDELIVALKHAQAQFVLELPGGLDSKVLPDASNFSGGQRQRLTIARALVGASELLILDDASSALDYETDAYLRNTLANLNKTMIVVSQRVSSVRSAHAVAVLDKGKLVGLGTHKELLANCEVYQEICASQMKDEELYA